MVFPMFPNVQPEDVIKRYWFMLLRTWYSEKLRYEVKRWPKRWAFDAAERMASPSRSVSYTAHDWAVEGFYELQRVEEWLAGWQDPPPLHLHLVLKARHQGFKVRTYWGQLDPNVPLDYSPLKEHAEAFDKLVETMVEFLQLGARLAPAGSAWRFARALQTLFLTPVLAGSVPEHLRTVWVYSAPSRQHSVLAWFAAHPDHAEVMRLAGNDVRAEDPQGDWRTEFELVELRVGMKDAERERAQAAAWTAFREADAARFTPVLYTLAQIRSNAWAKTYDHMEYVRKYTPWAV